MNSTDAATDAPSPRAASRALRFAAAHFHWLPAGIAVLLVFWRLFPAAYLSEISADGIQFGIFFRDIVDRGHHVRDWVWGGHTDIFPDLTFYFLINFVLRSELLSQYVTTGIFFAAFIGAFVVLHRMNGGRAAATFAAALFLFFTFMLIDFHVAHGVGFKGFFVLPMHVGVIVLAPVCLIFFQRAAFDGAKKSFLLLAVFSFLGSTSDPLFLVIFPVPFVAAAAATVLLYPARWRSLLCALGVVLPACAIGHKLANRIFPAIADAAPYTHFDPHSARFSWDYLCYTCKFVFGGDMAFFLGLDAGFIALVACLFVIALCRPAVKRMPPALMFLLVFSACLIVSNISATVLSGNYYSEGHVRYFRLALILPPVFLIAWINQVLPWSRAACVIAASALWLAAAWCAISLRPAPNYYYATQKKLIPFLSPIMAAEHIDAGLSEYWFANLTTFFSNDQVTIRSIYSDGAYFKWLTNIRWFQGFPSAPLPQFRFIYMARLDADRIRMIYGAPSRIVRAPTGEDVWIYPPEKAITYDPVFDRLSNAAPHQYRVPAALLPSQTGKREGDSLIARTGTDREGTLTYGPYLHPPAGRYRVAITYAYPARPPAPGKLAGYDTSLWDAKMTAARPIDNADLPFIDTATHTFEREIVIPASDDHHALEVHTSYHNSGDLRVDTIEITWLGGK